MHTFYVFSFFFFFFFLLLPVSSSLGIPGPSFNITGSTGVPAMHAFLMPNGNVVFLDKIENYTELRLPNGKFAYSSEYNPATQELTPLSVDTNPFCCGGAFLSDGRVVSLGGNGPLEDLDPTVGNGFDAIRYLKRDDTNFSEGWSEPGNKLASSRWYASAQTLLDGTVFVASGSLNGRDYMDPKNNNPTYEVLDKSGISSGEDILMGILVDNQPYYMYPFLHLLKGGSLFVFTSKSCQIFNVAHNKVIKQLPALEGMYRTYPNTGGSVLFPLSSKNKYEAEIMICGGGQYQDLSSPTDNTCGIIHPHKANPEWRIIKMPGRGRSMVEGILLPDGTILWLNGAHQGAEGFGIARDPAYTAMVYNPATDYWQASAGLSTIPRLYHSVALLLLDGTVLVAGSNPNEQPILSHDVDRETPERAYPTEFRFEIYTPSYLQNGRRPANVSISDYKAQSGGHIHVHFDAETDVKEDEISVVLYHGGFVTHALHMGQRLVSMDFMGFQPGRHQILTAKVPIDQHVLPPGPYVVYVVVKGVPSMGKFILIR